MALYCESFPPPKPPRGIRPIPPCASVTTDVRELLEGVSLVFHTVDTLPGEEMDAGSEPPLCHTLAITHCRAGQVRYAFADSPVRCLMRGEISVELLHNKPARLCFPEGSYSGVSVVVVLPRAQCALNKMMTAVTQTALELDVLEEAVCESGGLILPDAARNEALFSSLYLAARHPQDAALQRLRVLEILGHICHAVTATQQKYGEPPRDAKMLAVQEYLLRNYRRHITLKELANRFALSETTLKQRFLAAFGTTADRYMRRYRLERAAELLRTTDRKIADIAREVGFQSCSIFSVRFSEQFGLPPGKYRHAAEKTAKTQSSIKLSD